MASLKTVLSEVTTALGLASPTGLALDDALATPPPITNATNREWDLLRDLRSKGLHPEVFERTYKNGQVFLRAKEGLRGRAPILVEWRGGQNPPGYDQIPADIRVDHVFLISCKDVSKNIQSPSPRNLFDRRLRERSRQTSTEKEWYLEVAVDEYQRFYSACLAETGLVGRLPSRPDSLSSADRKLLKARLPTGPAWPPGVRDTKATWARAVAQASAIRWQTELSTSQRKEEMLWRLIRLAPAPYFLLGTSTNGSPMRLRIMTPWDWRQTFTLLDFRCWGDPHSEQANVRWRARVRRRTGGTGTVDGHIEVRWSHGKFHGVTEAKVYIDSPFADLPGYELLT